MLFINVFLEERSKLCVCERTVVLLIRERERERGKLFSP